MNFARFCWLNASKFPGREFIIESYPSKGIRKAITWQQLDDQTNRLANFMMNSIEWYVCYMSVLKTGATVPPLNFRFASSDIKYAADVTKCKVFMLGDGFLPRVEPIMKEMGYVKKYICVGGQAPATMVSYEEIMEEGDPTDVLVE